jgi:hypothetical protein
MPAKAFGQARMSKKPIDTFPSYATGSANHPAYWNLKPDTVLKQISVPDSA